MLRAYWFAEQIDDGEPLVPSIFLTHSFLRVTRIEEAQAFEDRDACVDHCIMAARKLGLPFDAVKNLFPIP